MWDRLRKQVAVEAQQLHRLLQAYRPLLEKCATDAPNEVELSALAAMLHSFYNGIENILKRATVELGDSLPSGEFWHQELLDAMTRATSGRGPLISPPLRVRLKEYLEFRHFFRHAYIFSLRWDRMKALVLECEETLRRFEAEVDSFLRRAG